MRNLTIIILLFICCFTVNALPTDTSDAKKVARNFLYINANEYSTKVLTLCDTWYDAQGPVTMYVFNIGNDGFIIISADDDFTPVIGYSFNGAYHREALPDNFRGWMECCHNDMAALSKTKNVPSQISKEREIWKSEWRALRNGDVSFYGSKGSKAVQPLISSHWSQGAGYNNYCPEYSENADGHAVTGCVATAMAQIIRYHAYPNTGFSHKSYVHDEYGRMYASFDSAYYDYTLMPDEITPYSSPDEQHAVSLLCYHCGISVSMNYQYTYHTSGSGASSNDVPKALKFFGYTNSYVLNKASNNDRWTTLLRNDLDKGLPVYYSGNSGSDGHAFICDGYTNTKFHFNFGWGGYTDGDYSLNSVNGYSSAQAAVFNIIPSGIASGHDTIYVDAASHGDGSSWTNATPNLESAIILRGLYKSGNVWVKSGIYYGDTCADVSFTVGQGIHVYGGFNGTEESIDQRNSNAEPSVLSGDNKRAVLKTPTIQKETYFYNLTFANGYADNASAVLVKSNLFVIGCIVENNHTNNGAAVSIESGNMFNTIIRNNEGGAVNISGGNIKNSLIVHNNGYGVKSTGGKCINIDIVSNAGSGFINNGGLLRNSIVWNNDTSIDGNIDNNIIFSAIEGYVDTFENSVITLSSENEPSFGVGPIFIEPNTTRGITSEMGDWHLAQTSSLRDAGDTLVSGLYSYDLDNKRRVRSGRVDMGCYETEPNASIETPSVSHQLQVYPNPSTDIIHIESSDGELDIFDIYGRHILHSKITDGQCVIDINAFPNGIYLIRTQEESYKFIKK